ncbi:putative transporter [Trachipleistophora hominis]|uniref:Putative transporter n=1 Tax=Trachipleistophora hominis TaxID=72359 RepID=L7JR03_TRAHO|nr:putative transporter [Trachipleistophora hominis]
MMYVVIFCTLLLLEIASFGISVYSSDGVQYKQVYLVHGSTILLGNMFLVEGIMLRNFNQVILYPVIYSYTLAITFLSSSTAEGLYFAFKMVHVGIFVLRGLVLCYVINRLRREFSWYSTKRLGTNERVIGKLFF